MRQSPTLYHKAVVITAGIAARRHIHDVDVLADIEEALMEATLDGIQCQRDRAGRGI